MSEILVFREGVLQSRRGDRPISEGFEIVYGLSMVHRLIIATEKTTELVQHQLRNERLSVTIADVVDQSLDLPPLPLWQRQIEYVRAGLPTLMVLSDDPEVVEWTLVNRMTAMLFSHPAHSGAALRPQHGNRRWETLVEELEARR